MGVAEAAMETLCTSTGVDSQCDSVCAEDMMFDAHSASMARWAERAAVEVYIWYTNATVSFMRWRMHHRDAMEM